jgi:beta-lactamase regulating signal transducer with metallopeptidase domain
MLRALGPAEREALLAHERAHLAGRHHVFLAALELACACHPALRLLRGPLSYALERGADEAAATAVGDRRLAALAIGHAALAGRPAARPRVALSVAAGPVPRRVAALLTPRPARTPRVLAVAVVAALVLSAGCALHAAVDLHTSIEVAQQSHGGA